MRFLSRFRVATNRAALPYINIPKPFSLVGPDSSLTLCRILAKNGFRRVMLVTDETLLKLGVLTPVQEALGVAGIEVELFGEVKPDPDYEMVLAGVKKLTQCRAQAILAVGGGSPIDCAKAIMLCHANGRHPSRLLGLWLYAWPRRKGLPFYAIPTTAGTGSEATIAAVISDKATRAKAAIADPKLVPSIVALDPRLTLGLPPFVTAATGMDALTHAIEAYISTMAMPETDEMARMAVTAILRALPATYCGGGDLEAREDLLVASCFAGMAFTRAGVGYVHAIAHQLGGLYHVPHGLANAIVLPHVLEYSKPACLHRLGELAIVSGIAAPDMTPAERADALIEHIRRMNTSMGIPSTVAELRREDFGTIVSRAFAEAHGTYGVPRYLGRKDACSLLEQMLPSK
jgi:alcohol dehydrogenase